MTARPKRPLGELLVLELDPVEVIATEEYRIAGVYGFGRGLFERNPIAGSDTSYKSLNRLRTERLVLSRLKAFEGAVAVVPKAFDGCLLSPEFPTFRCVDGELESRYLAHLCKWPDFWAMLAASSKGIGSRRERVHATNLLNLEFRFPRIDEQRQVAIRLERSANEFDLVATGLARNSDDTIERRLPGIIDKVLARDQVEKRLVSDVASFVADTVHPGDDPSPATSFVGLQHIASHTGLRLGSDPLGEMKGRKFRFQPGDVLYGYLRPYLNKVWVADRHGLCSVDQYVLRPHAGVNADVLAHNLRSQRLLNKTSELTHNLQLPRLRSGLLASLPILIPTGNNNKIATTLNGLRDDVVCVATKRQRQIGLASALLPAALNEAFGGLR